MQDWNSFFDHYQPSASYRDDGAAAHVCMLAATAGRLGTYAVGAVLLTADGNVVAEGHNEVFVGEFRSDLHAEMVVLNKFEGGQRGQFRPADLTLVSSLEPCPMCMARIIYAGVGTVRYVCDDPDAGMVTRKGALPPFVQQISNSLPQVWEQAQCSEELKEAALHIFEQSREQANRRLVEHGVSRTGRD